MDTISNNKGTVSNRVTGSNKETVARRRRLKVTVRLESLLFRPDGRSSGTRTPTAGTLCDSDFFQATDAGLGTLSSKPAAALNGTLPPSRPALPPDTVLLRLRAVNMGECLGIAGRDHVLTLQQL